jgi:cell division protease FtsH
MLGDWFEVDGVNRRWRNIGLIALVPLALMVVLGLALFERSPETVATQPQIAPLEYAEFIQQVQADRINQVALSADRSKAIVTRDDAKFVVQLPADPSLVDTLTKNAVDITVSPSAQTNTWFWIIHSLRFPILILGGLLVLLILGFGNFMRG